MLLFVLFTVLFSIEVDESEFCTLKMKQAPLLATFFLQHKLGELSIAA